MPGSIPSFSSFPDLFKKATVEPPPSRQEGKRVRAADLYDDALDAGPVASTSKAAGSLEGHRSKHRKSREHDREDRRGSRHEEDGELSKHRSKHHDSKGRERGKDGHGKDKERSSRHRDDDGKDKHKKRHRSRDRDEGKRPKEGPAPPPALAAGGDQMFAWERAPPHPQPQSKLKESSRKRSRSEPEPEPAAPDPSWSGTTKDKDPFYSDKRGDPDVFRYGGLHRGSVPKFWRSGRGKVMGLNPGLRIVRGDVVRDGGKAVEVAPSRRAVTPRYTDLRSYRHLEGRSVKRLKLAEIAHSSQDPVPQAAELNANFIPLIPEPASAKDEIDLMEVGGEQAHRSLEGPAREEEESSDDEFGAGIEGGTSFMEAVKQRNRELDVLLREQPGAVDLWLEFAELQEEVAVTSFVDASGTRGASRMRGKRKLSKSEKRSTAEIKLSILERALKATPDDGANEQSEKLWLTYLRTGAEVWSAQKTSTKWRSALRDHADLTGLWLEFVAFEQTSWAEFELGKVERVFGECLQVLEAAKDREAKGSERREVLEQNAVYLFLRCCLMLRQAGHAERALGTFQALVEFNLFCPKHFGKTRVAQEVALDELEEWWDFGPPRIGEEGAQGWKNTDWAAPKPPDFPAYPAAVVTDAEDPFISWGQLEAREQSSRTCRAFRVEEVGYTLGRNVSEEDVVLFADFRHLLFRLDSGEAKIQLAYAFTTYLGLPFVPPDCPTTSGFQTDGFVQSEAVERPALRELFWPKNELVQASYEVVEGEAMEPERRSALGDPWQTPFRAVPMTPDVMLDTKPAWFSLLKKMDLAGVDIDFARNAFALLRPVVHDPFFALAQFSFEASQDIKPAMKVAKEVLRIDRKNLLMWDGYARAELMRNKPKEARAIYTTALSAYKLFDAKDQVDGPLLWRAWAEMEWGLGRPKAALRVLLALTGHFGDWTLESIAQLNETENVPGPVLILRARAHLTQLLDSAFHPDADQSTLRSRVHFCSCAALLEYLSSGNDVQPACAIYERQLSRLADGGDMGSAEHEETLESYAKLLYRHATTGVGYYRPEQLRRVLEVALRTFPNNSIFLAMFHHNESRMKIQNRVRTTLESSVLPDETVTAEGYLFAIFAEMHFDARSYNVSAVRGLFDRAVDNPRTGSAPAIWSLYIDFEMRSGSMKSAKDVWHRGVQACPWCKALYLKAFQEPLRSQFSSKELRDWYQLLHDKGLRVRAKLDVADYSSEVDAMDEDEDDEDYGPKTEAEEMLGERARLMPY